MSFTSVPFLLLVAAGLLLYRIVPQKLRWCVLLAVSCVFYLSGGISRLWYLLFTGLSTYGAGLLLGRLNAGGRVCRRNRRRPAVRRSKIKSGWWCWPLCF